MAVGAFCQVEATQGVASQRVCTHLQHHYRGLHRLQSETEHLEKACYHVVEQWDPLLVPYSTEKRYVEGVILATAAADIVLTASSGEKSGLVAVKGDRGDTVIVFECVHRTVAMVRVNVYVDCELGRAYGRSGTDGGDSELLALCRSRSKSRPLGRRGRGAGRRASSQHSHNLVAAPPPPQGSPLLSQAGGGSGKRRRRETTLPATLAAYLNTPGNGSQS